MKLKCALISRQKFAFDGEIIYNAFYSTKSPTSKDTRHEFWRHWLSVIQMIVHSFALGVNKW